MRKVVFIVFSTLAIAVVFGCNTNSSAGAVSSETATVIYSSDESISSDALKPYQAVEDFMCGDGYNILVVSFQDELDYLVEDIKAGNVDVISAELSECESAGESVPELYKINGDPESCSLVCAWARTLATYEASYLSSCIDAATAMKHGDESLAIDILEESQSDLEKVTEDIQGLVDAYEKMMAEYSELRK